MSKPLEFTSNFNIDPKYSQPHLLNCKTVEIFKIVALALTLCAAVATALAFNLHALNAIPHLGAICGYSTLGGLGITLALMCVDKAYYAKKLSQREQRRMSDLEQIESMKSSITQKCQEEVLPPPDQRYYVAKKIDGADVIFVRDDQSLHIEVFSDAWSSQKQKSDRTTYAQNLVSQGYKHKNFVSRQTIMREKLPQKGAEFIEWYQLGDQLEDMSYCIVKTETTTQQPIYIVITKLEEVDGRPEHGGLAEHFCCSISELDVLKGKLRQEGLTYQPDCNIGFEDQ